MKPKIYILLVTVIVLPFNTTVQAQMNPTGSFQSKSITTNKQQPLASDISSTWYNEALKGIKQLEEQIKPVSTQGSFNATNLRGRTGFYI